MKLFPSKAIKFNWLWGIMTITLTGCSTTASKDEPLAGNIQAVNHTLHGINWLKVNGYQADGGGGTSCCIVMPATWRPGLKAAIEWEVDPDPYGYAKWPKDVEGYRAAMEKHRSNYRHYTEAVEIPRWEGTKRCGISVHFLVCNKVKVTTSCWGYGSPNNPIKEPLDMKEPATCPK
ncbi:DUF3304 domain-containing protein [Pseudomonas sp. SCB32]|uniref:DUF3304 domain-containing protein n=1 Tax=Pseudomonas sp. SCB32 TaxID=2653853 RepID=UPI00126550E1|nr:DUF3304 domain-containing protein [Pseudomonas sp. SCB32]